MPAVRRRRRDALRFGGRALLKRQGLETARPGLVSRNDCGGHAATAASERGWSRRTATARIAVVRVSVSAAPRGREKPAQPRTAAAHAERAAFGALQQHHGDDHRDRNEKLNDDEHGLHGAPKSMVSGEAHSAKGERREELLSPTERLQRWRGSPGQRRLAPPTSAPSTLGKPRMVAALAGLTEPAIKNAHREPSPLRLVSQLSADAGVHARRFRRAAACGRCRSPRSVHRRRRSFGRLRLGGILAFELTHDDILRVPAIVLLRSFPDAHDGERVRRATQRWHLAATIASVSPCRLGGARNGQRSLPKRRRRRASRR